MVWTKAAKIGDFGHWNLKFVHYNLSKWAPISRTYIGKNLQQHFVYKNQFDQV